MAKRKRTASGSSGRRPGETHSEYQLRDLVAKAQVQQLKAMLATYNAATRGRANKDWKATTGSADAAIIPDSPILNARSRQTVRDNWIGASMILAARRNVSGIGIDVVPLAKDSAGKPLKKLNDFLRGQFWRWAGDKRNCDVEQRQTFYQKQRLAVRERYTVGQHFIVWDYKPTLSRRGEVRVDKSKPIGLRLRSMEPEQLDPNLTSFNDGQMTREVRGGVELDPETNAAVAYHFYARNPNDYLSKSFQSRRIPASRVLHYFDQERVMQTVGVSKLAAVMQEIRHFGEFNQSTLFRARMEACIGLVIKQAAGALPGQSPIAVAAASGDSRTTSGGMTEIDFTPGMAPHLAPGEEIETIMPTSPGNQFLPFTDVTLRGIGAGAGMSYDQVARRSDGNYSAARQTMLEDWKEWEIEQDDLMGDIIFPVYELFFHFMMLEQRLEGVEGWDANDFADEPARLMEAACIAPAKPWIDPEKEANAWAKLIDYKLVTREEIMTARSRRFVEMIEQIGAEQKAAETVNVSFPEDVDARVKQADTAAKEADALAKTMDAQLKKAEAEKPVNPERERIEMEKTAADATVAVANAEVAAAKARLEVAKAEAEIEKIKLDIEIAKRPKEPDVLAEGEQKMRIAKGWADVDYVRAQTEVALRPPAASVDNSAIEFMRQVWTGLPEEQRANFVDIKKLTGGVGLPVNDQALQKMMPVASADDADINFKRDVVKSFLADGTVVDIVYNASDVPDLLKAVHLKLDPEVEKDPDNAIPWLPVLTDGGQMVSGEVVRDSSENGGDIVGGGVIEPQPAAPPSKPPIDTAVATASPGDEDGVDPATAELAAKVDVPPNYRLAETELARCSGCRYFNAGKCTEFHNQAVLGDHMCDAFSTRPITEGAGSRRMAPGVEDGQRPMDDPRSPLLDRGHARELAAKKALQSTSDTPNVLEDVKNKTVRKHKEELAAGAAYDFSSTQIEVPEPLRGEVLKLLAAFPDGELYTEEEKYGRETEPHITVLYGLEDEEPTAVETLLAGVGPIRVKLGATTIFSREDKPYDVVVVDVESDDLVKLNAKLRELPHQSDYPDYKPHMTLAYVKKGVGEMYAGLTDFWNSTFTVDSVTFSSKSGKRTAVKLKAEKPA